VLGKVLCRLRVGLDEASVILWRNERVFDRGVDPPSEAWRLNDEALASVTL